MAVKFKSSININDQYTLPSSVGLTGQYLKVNDAATGELIFADLGEAAQVSTIAYEVRNETGVSIPKGSVVYISGGSGSSDHVLISLASASTEVGSSKTFGITAETIPNNSTGDVVLEGIIEGIDTSAFTNGGTLWLGDTPGSIQASPPPSTPSHAVFVGYAVRIQQNNGSMFVKIQNGYELEELHDVLITNVQDGEGLVWDAANSYWKNADLASISGGSSTLVVEKNEYTGDGTTVNFTLSSPVQSESQTQVYIDGVYQSKNNYTTSGSVITFSEAPDPGTDVEVIHLVAVSAVVNTDAFTGDGSTSQYTLSNNVKTENNTQVYFDGVYQSKSTYDLSGNVITFSENVPNGVEIEVVHLRSVDLSSLNSSQLIGDGVTTDFTLNQSVDDKDKTFVFLQGVYQEKSTYNISGSSISFSTPPPSGRTIEVMSFSTLSVVADTLYLDAFSGNGTQTDYTISSSPSTENAVDVYINGLYQEKSTFSLNGNTITFSTPPPSTSTIEVKSIAGISGTPQNVNYGVVIATSNTNASKNTLYVLKAELTLTLPASPAVGDSIKISNLSGVATCVLGANGNNIMATAGDLTLDDATKSFELIYTDTTNGWVIIG